MTADPTTPEGRAKWQRDLDKVLGDELVIELRRRGAGELLTLLHEFDRVREAGRIALALADAEKHRADVAEAALAEAQDTIRGYESAVEGLATTIGEQRQQLSAIRAYAQELHALADTTRDAGGDYLAHTYREIATALERKIGGAS